MHRQLCGLLVASVAVTAKVSKEISAISWGGGRIDVFGIHPDESIWHKFYPGGNAGSWEPQGSFENMRGKVPHSGVTPISWGEGRLDYFVVGTDRDAAHKYWDGSGNWQPVGKYHEHLGGILTSDIAATTWGEGRMDLVARGTDHGYYHLFFDGSDWKPTPKDWENFGGKFQSEPAVVAWGHNRLDVIGISNGSVLHKYWNGEKWAPGVEDWEDLSGESFVGDPRITSPAPGRFDVWAVGKDGNLYHKAWNGIFYTEWHNLGGDFDTAPPVVHIAPGYTQIVGLFQGNDTQYHSKFFDGWSWYPSGKQWQAKGGDFRSQPALVSTRANEFNILGVGNDGELKLQFWTGYDFQPGPKDYYSLGDADAPYSSAWWDRIVKQPEELK